MVRVNTKSPVLVSKGGNILLSKIGVVIDTRPKVWDRRDVYYALVTGGVMNIAYRVNNQLEAVGEPYTND